MTNFSVDWFNTSGRANFEKYLAEFKGKPLLKFLEIGCFEGQATKWILDNIFTKGDLITVIDTFEGSMEHKDSNVAEIKDLYSMLERFNENTKGYDDNIIIKIGRSQEVLRNIPFCDCFDFIYVDGSHTAYDVLEDTVLAFRRLKSGGIMIFDDYCWNGYPDDLTLNPKLGIDAFLDCYSGQYELLFKEYQVGIRKITNVV